MSAALDDSEIARAFMETGLPQRIARGEKVVPEDWFEFARSVANRTAESFARKGHVPIPHPDTTHYAQWQGESIRYHSVDQIVAYGTARVAAAHADHTSRRARKTGGSYQAEGTIVSEFKTRAGERRFVFEFDNPKGMLHIFSGAQLEFLP